MLLHRQPFDPTEHATRRMRRVLCGQENKMAADETEKTRNDPLEYCTKNLLENNICVKLRKPPIKKVSKSATVRNKESRESKEIFHLTKCPVETPDLESIQKHHKHSKRLKSADMSQTSNPESHERVISWAADAEAYLPVIHKSQRKYGTFGIRESLDKSTGESFPKLDALGFKWINSSSVKMMKLNGVFQPVNKYERLRINHNSEIPLSKPILDYETLVLPVKVKPAQKQSDWCGTADSKLKVDTRVSWSSNVRAKQDSAEKCPTTTSQSRRTVLSSATPFSDKAVSLCSPFRKPEYNPGKSKVGTVGVKWAFSRGEPRHLTQSAPVSRGKKDLHPVTTAMDREGTSLERTRGKVITSSCSHDSHAYWMETLKSIKSPSYGLDSNIIKGMMVDMNLTRDICIPAFDSLYVMAGETTPSL